MGTKFPNYCKKPFSCILLIFCTQIVAISIFSTFAAIWVQKVQKVHEIASYNNLEIWSRLVPKTHPERQNKMALKWRREAKIGPNAPHVV